MKHTIIYAIVVMAFASFTWAQSTNTPTGGFKSTVVTPTGYDGSEALVVTASTFPAITMPTGCGSGTQATLGWGDADTGFCEFSDDVLYMIVGNTVLWEATGSTIIGGIINGRPVLRDETASATNPNIGPRSEDFDTGLGGVVDDLALIAGGIHGIQIDEDASRAVVTIWGTNTIRSTIFYGKVESAAPTEPVVCSATTETARVYVDDTDDGITAKWCVCVDTDDGVTFDWRREDDNDVACPFF